ncbi:MAG: hypothetical protein EXQ81_00720 [Thermoleophilia bacterium]|nr:hypothetical protein [Thermoleophilia bacterium]
MSTDAPGLPAAGFDRPLLEHEVRRDGRVIATLRAHYTETGVTVESRVFPVTENGGTTALNRPFAFSTIDHARRFVDEALVAFEYLNCTVA